MRGIVGYHGGAEAGIGIEIFDVGVPTNPVSYRSSPTR